MKHFVFCLFFFALLPNISHGDEGGDLFPPGFLQAAPQNEGWVALPRGRPFRSLLSDPRDLKLGLRKNSRGSIEGDIGAYRSVAGWKGQFHDEETIFHTGIEATAYFDMKREGSKFPLQSSDGLIGIYGEAMRGLWLYQLRYTHISAHLSDGLYGLRSRIVYTRETLSLRVARQISFVRAYLGYHFLVHTVPVLPRHSAQIGAYAIFPWNWNSLHPYLGADLRVKGEEEGTTYNLVAGLALVGTTGAPPIRLSLAYLNGHDPRGQFYNERLKKFSAGLDLDF